MDLFILGAGFSGQEIARRMDGAARITGTSRAVTRFEALQAAGIEPVLFDGECLTDTLLEALARTTHLVQSVRPNERGDPLLRLTGGDLKRFMPKLQWVCYLSTVGVYGDHDGAWVTEETPSQPVNKRSQWRVDAEQGWLEFSKRTGMPVAIARLGGIYGPGRNTFVKIDRGEARRLVKPGQVFNRIHVADVAGAVDHLAKKQASGFWNVVDNEPCPPQDVVTFACNLMGVEPPPEIAFEDADLTPMARSFYADNKRVSNAKLRESGYRFQYPDYRAALEAMWSDGSWRG
ncbi:DUF1731 domain-containing protein [Hoeflea sp. WL0058]|uniref:DUF1731 domain-containing protein n=1 Tax=Flavimaribacter sediminis TaxID=2865987 RepID=A0AAE2ZP00_9HYPH|nr:SDR family NAD(P)-dependent oxidoreductase [Flavimaribacter sediminis]MBW8638052.1 DUF1731 domain-containing protein [Flavimaribacter sediminis]